MCITVEEDKDKLVGNETGEMLEEDGLSVEGTFRLNIGGNIFCLMKQKLHGLSLMLKKWRGGDVQVRKER